MAFAAMTAAADTKQQVTIGGEAVDKAVTAITFDGDNVTLTFDDSTDLTADMGEVSIAMDYGSEETAIVSPTARRAADGTIVNLNGQRMDSRGDRLPKGIYIINGKKRIVR